jgi:hypothetical protein
MPVADKPSTAAVAGNLQHQAQGTAATHAIAARHICKAWVTGISSDGKGKLTEAQKVLATRSEVITIHRYSLFICLRPGANSLQPHNNG